MIGFVVVMVGVLVVVMVGVLVVVLGVIGGPVVPVVVNCVVGVPVVLGQASGTKQQIIPKTSEETRCLKKHSKITH